ncbi:hypothetical protein [Roseisalinus antarcticus]|uniref:hypothetical protein n=1 Tax=Roseisalinus antarcticus TaxID=254357 RepID=UPI001356558D|nr:hypothetical protein [Roseisalinus antarcticus]
MPEQLLARAVLAQAVIDLFSVSIACSTPDEAVTARRDALAFLTDADSVWAESRRTQCLLADHDPDVIRSRVVAILNGGRLNDDAHGYRLAGVEMARELWTKERERQRTYYAKAREKVKVRRETRWAESLRVQDRRIKDQRIAEKRASEPDMWRGLDRSIATHSELVDDLAAYLDIEL